MDIIKPILAEEKIVQMKNEIQQLRQEGKTILPTGKQVLNAFRLCPYEKTRVVIIGQDPYPDPKHPHGLAFSSLADETPESLGNIFREVRDDLYPEEELSECFASNNLTNWAEQGVLLLNAVLTVEAFNTDSHKNIGWEYFTGKVIDHINQMDKMVIFLLWGKKAQEAGKRIDNPRHKILTAAHPSPLSASKGFFGCKHFSQVNELLKKDFYANFVEKLHEVAHTKEIIDYYHDFLTEKNMMISNGDAQDLEKSIEFYISMLPEYLAKHIIKDFEKHYTIDFKTY